MSFRLPAFASVVLLSGCYLLPFGPCPPNSGIEKVFFEIEDGTYVAPVVEDGPGWGTIDIEGDLVVHTYLDEEGREVQVAWEVTGSSWDD